MATKRVLHFQAFCRSKPSLLKSDTNLVSVLQAFLLLAHSPILQWKWDVYTANPIVSASQLLPTYLLPTPHPYPSHHFIPCLWVKFNFPFTTYKGHCYLAPAHHPSPSHLQFIQQCSTEPFSAQDCSSSPSSLGSGLSYVFSQTKHNLKTGTVPLLAVPPAVNSVLIQTGFQ